MSSAVIYWQESVGDFVCGWVLKIMYVNQYNKM